jgi:hypothetical protein
MSLIYNADALKLLKENAKRHDNVELFKFDVHPRVHHIDDIVEKIYEELAALDGASGGGKWSDAFGSVDIYRNSKVGIGDFSAAAPAEALEVQGNIQVTGATAMFIGDINGAVLQKVKVKEAGGVSKGDVVYISGGTGDNPEVMKARANSASTMAALGIIKETAAFNATAECITSGELTGLDLTGFATGDDLYVSSSVAGELVNAAPAGEANLIQKIGKVIKGGNGGALTVLGAFRSNATPNLNQGSIFIGDASGQSSTLAIGGANTFLKSNGTTAAWSSISLSDLPTNLALVGSSSNNGFVPRFNATINTIEKGTIRDDGTNISVGDAVNSERKVNIDNNLNANTDKYGLYIDNTTASGTSGALYGQKIALSSTGGSNENYGLDIQLQANGGSPDELKALVINQFTSNAASGTVSFDIAGIEVGVGATAAGYTVNGDIRAIDILEVGTGATITGSTYGIYQQGAGDLNYFAGNVGIATDPLVELHVKGSQAIIRLESSDATGKNYLEFWDTSAIKGYMGYGSGTTNVFSIVNYEAGEDLNMWTTDSGGTTRTAMIIDSDQNVSITNGNLSYNKQVYQTGGVYNAGNTGASLTLNFDNGNIQECTMNAASITIANPTNAKDGSTVTICFIQDATASRTIASWGSNWNWGDAGAPDFSGGTAAGDKFYVTVIVNGTELDAIYSGVKH